jgi:hypothetical protein
MLQHFKQTATGDWIHTRSRLIKEFNCWVSKKRDCAAKLTLIAATQLTCLFSAELSQIKGLLDELTLKIDVLSAQPLDSTDHV